MKNSLKMEFDSKSVNEGFARSAVAAFVAQRDVTIEEMADIKTAVSEAVTNAIVHGYEGMDGTVRVLVSIEDANVTICVDDDGVGIEDIRRAREPLFTTRPEEERSGMGFTIMESFMDSLHIVSEKGKGTSVTMTKKLKER
ncbi:MAG: anti-sigma F factor [Clostridia bacterium]|nr:anti-sigma F factor [Clostridia bacterium]